MKKKIRKVLLAALGSSLLLAQDRPQCNNKHDGWYWVDVDGSVKACAMTSGKYRWSGVLGSMSPFDTAYVSGNVSITVRPPCNKEHKGWSWTTTDGLVKTCYLDSGKYKWAYSTKYISASDTIYAPGSGPGTELAIRDKDGVARRHSSK